MATRNDFQPARQTASPATSKRMTVMQVEITFRGKPALVNIDQIIDEPDVNYASVDWHFEDDDLNKVQLTADEESDICDELWEKYHD